MGTVKRKLMPSGMYRTGMLETWFRDMSLEGLHVNEFGYYFAAFDKGEPKDMIYSMDIMAKDPGKDELQVFSDCGWEHVSYRRDVHLFRTDANSGARPIHTDITDRELTIKRLERKMKREIVIISILLIISIVTSEFILMKDRDFYLTFIERGAGSIIGNFALLLIILVRTFEEFTGIRELGRHLRGEADQKTGWKQPMRKRKGYVAALALVLVSALYVTVYEFSDSGMSSIQDYQTSRVLMLSGIEIRKDLYHENDNSILFYEPKSTLADSMYIGSEKLKSSDGYEPHLGLYFYDLRFPSLSGKVIEGWEFRISKGMLSKLDDPYLDYVSFEEKSGYSTVLASKGDLVLVAMYTGDQTVSLVVSSVREYLMRIDETRK
jgi:hypothetical protein